VLLGTRRGVDNFIPFLTIGVFAFHFTSRSLNAGAKSITSNEGLIRAISFPRAILPLAVVLSELVAFGYSLGTMIVVVLAFGEPITLQWLLVVPIIVLLTLFNIGVALFVARLSDHFRDVQQVLPFVVRLWFYGSGVIWPATRLTDKWPELSWLLTGNPVYAYLSLLREALLRGDWATPALWMSAVLWAFGGLTVGFLFFRGREHEYGHA
jgi:teichoic acid transport system permease protein